MILSADMAMAMAMINICATFVVTIGLADSVLS